MNFELGQKMLEEKAAALNTEAVKQLNELFDDGSFTELDKFLKNGDAGCDVITAYGNVDGVLTFAFAQSKGANGAMGKALAAKIKKVYAMAEKVGAPVVGIYNSDGAHIDEGIDAMEAYGELMAYTASLSGVVPQISVVVGDCIGSAAVLAAMSDVVIMVEGAEMYVTAGSILKDEKVGGTALAAENGTAAYIAKDDADAYLKVAELISYLPQNNLATPLYAEYVPANGTVNGTEPYEVINAVADADSFCELYAEHAKCAVVGFARINGAGVGLVATNTEGGKLCAKGTKKIARFVRFCDAFSIPVVTFLDASGILGNLEDELSGGVKCAAQLTQAYAEATTAKITVITGAACGAAYIALASKAAGIDSVFAWTTAYVSALEPKTAVEFLKREELKDATRDELMAKYCEEDASAFAAAEKGYVEDVINPLETAPKLAMALDMLSSKRISTLNKKHSNIQL